MLNHYFVGIAVDYRIFAILGTASRRKIQFIRIRYTFPVTMGNHTCQI